MIIALTTTERHFVDHITLIKSQNLSVEKNKVTT